MKIPKKIKISGQIYKIFLKDRLRQDGQDALGTFDARVLKIWIASDLSKSQQETTLLHEIIEIINYDNQLGLDHRQISVLESNLYEVFKDNNLLK